MWEWIVFIIVIAVWILSSVIGKSEEPTRPVRRPTPGGTSRREDTYSSAGSQREEPYYPGGGSREETYTPGGGGQQEASSPSDIDRFLQEMKRRKAAEPEEVQVLPEPPPRPAPPPKRRPQPTPPRRQPVAEPVALPAPEVLPVPQALPPAPIRGPAAPAVSPAVGQLMSLLRSPQGRQTAVLLHEVLDEPRFRSRRR